MNPALLDPERQFIGCLMQLPRDPARRVLAGMRADDLGSPIASFVLGVAIRAMAGNQAPAPVVLFEHAHEITDRPRADRLRQIALWITDAYQDTPPAPEQNALYLKAVVLKAAWRRAIGEHAARLAQAVEQRWSTESLREVMDDTSAIDDLWNRYETAVRHGSLSARLEVAA